MSYYLLALKNYANFKDRARREAFWIFTLVDFLIALTLEVPVWVWGDADSYTLSDIPGGVYALATIVPLLAVTARRLHDTGRSAWYMLIFLIPLVGFIMWLIWCCSAGTPGPNQYGPDPKAGDYPAHDPGYPAYI